FANRDFKASPWEDPFRKTLVQVKNSELIRIERPRKAIALPSQSTVRHIRPASVAMPSIRPMRKVVCFPNPSPSGSVDINEVRMQLEDDQDNCIVEFSPSSC